MDSANGKITKNFFIVDLDFCLAALFEKVAHATACGVVSAASADKANRRCAGDTLQHKVACFELRPSGIHLLLWRRRRPWRRPGGKACNSCRFDAIPMCILPICVNREKRHGHHYDCHSDEYRFRDPFALFRLLVVIH